MPICQGCNNTYDDSFDFCPHCGRAKPDNKQNNKEEEKTVAPELSINAIIGPIILFISFALLGYYLGPYIIYGDRIEYYLYICGGPINYSPCNNIIPIRIGFSVLFGFIGAVIGKILKPKIHV